MRFMQTESVLQTKNRSGPAKNLFCVALKPTNPQQLEALLIHAGMKGGGGGLDSKGTCI